jgi:membrane protein DedA with SNARE-associated domain
MAIGMSNEAVRFYPLDQWQGMADPPQIRDMSRRLTFHGRLLINQSFANISLSGEAPWNIVNISNPPPRQFAARALSRLYGSGTSKDGVTSLSDALVSLIPIYGPWIIFGIVAFESAGVPLETNLIGAALLAATTGQIKIVIVVLAAAAGAIVGDGMGYMVGRRLGLPFLRRYGWYIRLDEDRLLIGWYLFSQYGNAVVFFGRFIALLRMFAALLAGANSMPAGRFFFFNITGGVCWACLFGFGAYAVGAEIYTISGTLSVISLGLNIML